MTEQQEKVREAIGAMRNLGVSLNDYDSGMLEILYQFAEDQLVAPSSVEAMIERYRVVSEERDTLKQTLTQVNRAEAELRLAYEELRTTNAAQAEQLAAHEAMLEFVDSVLAEAPCDCSHKMRYDNGQHYSSCYLFDLNYMRQALLQSTPAEPQATVELPSLEDVQEILRTHCTSKQDCLDTIDDILDYHEDKARALNQRQALKPLSAAQGVPEGWQPIETAPKDGTVIIALQCWIYHTDAARRPHYVLHEVFFNDDGGWEVVEDGEILDEDSLTHWLPRTRLPAAPEQAESKEGKP